MGPIGCPETSVRIYNYSLPINLEGRSFPLLHDVSLKSRMAAFCMILNKLFSY
jgi:hypothetical protein